MENENRGILASPPVAVITMEVENRLGGILSADVVSIADVTSVTLTNGYVSSLVLASGASWKSLPLSQLRSTVDPHVEESDAGQLLQTDVTLNMYGTGASGLFAYVSQAATNGCLLRVHYANGDVILYGTREWPMHGSLVRVPGQSAEDGHSYRLTLTSSVPYQGLH